MLAHYDHGVQPSATLHALLRPAGSAPGIPLTAQEQADLVAFLGTLTNNEFICDTRLAERP